MAAEVNVVIVTGGSGTTRTSSSIRQRAGRPPEAPPHPREALKHREVSVTDEEQGAQHEKLSTKELEQMGGEELPERAAMSLVNANVAIPINAAVAANVLSDDAIAYADATQDSVIDQSS